MTTIDTTINNSIVAFKKQLLIHKSKIDFSKLEKHRVLEQFLTLHIQFPPREQLNSWIFSELLHNKKDILVLNDQAVYRVLKNRDHELYDDLDDDYFNSISNRVFLAKDLESVTCSEKGYKVIFHQFNISKFNSKIYKQLTKAFPDTDFILGIN